MKTILLSIALLCTTSCAWLGPAERTVAFYDDDGTTIAMMHEKGNPLILMGEREFSINTPHTDDKGTTTSVVSKTFKVTKNTIGNMWTALVGFLGGLFAKSAVGG